jgi:hypothetical protein
VCIAAPDAALPVSVRRRHRRKDGTMIDVHILSHLLAFDRRPAVLAAAQDVTDRRETPPEAPVRVGRHGRPRSRRGDAYLIAPTSVNNGR